MWCVSFSSTEGRRARGKVKAKSEVNMLAVHLPAETLSPFPGRCPPLIDKHRQKSGHCASAEDKPGQRRHPPARCSGAPMPAGVSPCYARAVLPGGTGEGQTSPLQPTPSGDAGKGVLLPRRAARAPRPCSHAGRARLEPRVGRRPRGTPRPARQWGLSAARVQKHGRQRGCPADSAQPRAVPQAARPHPFYAAVSLRPGRRNVREGQSRSPWVSCFFRVCSQRYLPMPRAGLSSSFRHGAPREPAGTNSPTWPPPTAPFKLQARPWPSLGCLTATAPSPPARALALSSQIVPCPRGSWGWWGGPPPPAALGPALVWGRGRQACVPQPGWGGGGCSACRFLWHVESKCFRSLLSCGKTVCRDSANVNSE